MNERLSLQEISDRIALDNTLPSETHYGTSFDRDYVELVHTANPLPQIWVVGQRFVATDDGSKYSGLIRQSGRIEIVVRALFQRYADGQVSGEEMAQAIHDAVNAQLLGWTPTNAAMPLVWVESKDGLTVESMPTLDMKFQTTTDYQGV